jgi:photosynthetic reaction center M subunit
MLEYQNLFTRVQVGHAPDPGLPIDDHRRALRQGVFLSLAGKLGDAQIGPIYLGWAGISR